MRIVSGSTTEYIYFVAVDATDLKTRETGLSGFTVYRSRNNGAATAYTTPTVSEISAANMPGVYTLLVDEDTTIGAGNDSEEYCVHITQASMAPVTRSVELYRAKATLGTTIATANIDATISSRLATAGYTAPDNGTIATIQTDTNDIQSRLPAALVAGKMDGSVGAYQAGQTPADSVLVTPANKLATDGSGYVTEVNVDGVKKNAALSNFEFLMVDATDGYTEETGLSVTAQRSIDGGAFAACANAVSEVGNGIYKINLAATDLNGDVITLRFSAAGARTRYITIKTNQ